MTGAKILVVGCGLLMTTLAQTIPILEDGMKIGHMTAQAILGTACLALIASIVYLFKMFQKKRDENESKLLEIITEHTKHTQASTYAIKSQSSVLVEVKDAIIKCKHNED